MKYLLLFLMALSLSPNAFAKTYSFIYHCDTLSAGYFRKIHRDMSFTLQWTLGTEASHYKDSVNLLITQLSGDGTISLMSVEATSMPSDDIRKSIYTANDILITSSPRGVIISKEHDRLNYMASCKKAEDHYPYDETQPSDSW